MKNPLNKLKWWAKPKGYTAQHSYALPSDIDDVMADPQTIHTVSNNFVEVVHHRPGGVRKTKHKQYKIDDHPHGGRVVKTMPRQLRHMKELAEKTDE